MVLKLCKDILKRKLNQQMHSNQDGYTQVTLPGWTKMAISYIVGRKKELIKVGGLQVWPNEVEEVIREVPGVKECAVTGINDDYYGEVVKAWVVLETGSSITLESIKEFCVDKLVNYKIPKAIGNN